jgi:hypothetical protein
MPAWHLHCKPDNACSPQLACAKDGAAVIQVHLHLRLLQMQLLLILLMPVLRQLLLHSRRLCWTAK